MWYSRDKNSYAKTGKFKTSILLNYLSMHNKAYSKHIHGDHSPGTAKFLTFLLVFAALLPKLQLPT